MASHEKDFQVFFYIIPKQNECITLLVHKNERKPTVISLIWLDQQRLEGLLEPENMVMFRDIQQQIS
ncbi:hypothetical protein SDJN02_25012, partial [Cucurbita argyrosperma subsp. argyrosperma]